MLDHAAQAGRHANAARGFDLYETPPLATEALLALGNPPSGLWEPAAGRDAITTVLREHGFHVVASDIVDCVGLDLVRDFFAVAQVRVGVSSILTSPPFRTADRFVRYALDLATIYLLLRLALLESLGRTDILEHRGQRAIHVFRKRLPMMHRQGRQGPRASSSICFARFCWRRDWRGPTTVDRI